MSDLGLSVQRAARSTVPRGFYSETEAEDHEGKKLNSQQAVVKGTQMEELSNLRSRGKENSAQRIPFL